MSQNPTTHPTPSAGWVLYDGSCGVCRSGIHRWSELLQRQGFETRPIQDPWVQEQIACPQDELLKDLQLLLNDGRRLSGADAYRFIIRHIWWAYPLYLLSTLPGLRQLVNQAYRIFANNRHSISKACRLNTPNL
jgi:predicted DCC family thiol-disulfide oxidoreductase YuxK